MSRSVREHVWGPVWERVLAGAWMWDRSWALARGRAWDLVEEETLVKEET